MRKFALVLMVAFCIYWTICGSAHAYTCSHKMKIGKIHNFIVYVNLDSIIARMTIVGNGQVKIGLLGGMTLGNGKVSATVGQIPAIRKRGLYVAFITSTEKPRIFDAKGKFVKGKNAQLWLPLTSLKSTGSAVLVFTYKKSFVRNGKQRTRTMLFRKKIECK